MSTSYLFIFDWEDNEGCVPPMAFCLDSTHDSIGQLASILTDAEPIMARACYHLLRHGSGNDRIYNNDSSVYPQLAELNKHNPHLALLHFRGSKQVDIAKSASCGPVVCCYTLLHHPGRSERF